MKTAVSKRRRIWCRVGAIIVLLALSGVVASLVVYRSFFGRYERPDYEQYPGIYTYERIGDALTRQTMEIPAGDLMLQGYYYPCEQARGLVVTVHGYHAGADDLLPLIEAMVQNGYAVLAYDATGCYDSPGTSTVGMCQSLVDLDDVLDYVGQTEPYCQLPLMLVGHSWGGYAVASVLSLHPAVRACACLAPMNNGATVMVEKAEEYVGVLSYACKPVFDVYQRLLFGDYVEYNAVRGINSTDIPVLIAQGEDDTDITMHGQSIYAHLDELTNPNVTVYYGRGAQGSHTGIWHSDASEEYRATVTPDTTDIDHRLYSEVNGELVSLILAMFDDACRMDENN